MNRGIVKEKDMAAYYEWLLALQYSDCEELRTRLWDAVCKYHPEKKDQPYRITPEREQIDHLFTLEGGWASHPYTETLEYKWPRHLQARVDEYRQLFQFAETFNQDVLAAEWHPEYAVIYIGNSEKGLVVPAPEKYLEFTPAPSFDDVSPAQLKAQLALDGKSSNATDIVPAANGMTATTKSVKGELADAKTRLEDLKNEMDDVKHAKTGELAEIQAKIEAMKADLEAKKADLMASLQQKKDELEATKEKLETQIYMLESQIYAIRCYAGEVVNFTTIRSGKPAPVTEPVIVHQKLRFLDEELGKLASLYTIQWEKLNLFEEFLRHSPLAFDTFVPNERCIVLVRLSRTGKKLGRDTSEKAAYQNLLEAYDYYHGKTVGILIRNGKNLYLGWTDEDYVKIDDDLVNNIVDISSEEPEEPFYSDWEKKQYATKMKQKKRKAMEDVLSRVFVTNILQGIVDNSNLLPMPEGVRFDKPSEYIRYSVADTWLDDGRFGDFTKIIERCNETAKAGDMILTIQKLVPEHDRSWGSNSWASLDRPWENSRGRGEANRTHDCTVKDCTLYPINLVEYDKPVKMVRYRYKVPKIGFQEGDPEWSYGTMEEKYWDKAADADKELVERYEHIERHVFVSVEKQENWRRWGEPYERMPRSNFELYTNEYINLTCMNSIWLTWVITQKKLGGWRIGGKTVDYAYAIRYLNKALEYVRNRENEEKALIDAVDQTVCQNAEWPLKLSEWKMEKGVRTITAYQAKRFVKSIQAAK